MRPFGAIVFGRLGDMVGRKYTFLVTIVIMGLSTFVVGFLPGYASIGIAAPVIFIAMRLLQGLALGGEYGGAATYVAEHAPAEQARRVHRVDPDDGHARPVPLAARDPRRAHVDRRRDVRRLGLAHSVPRCRSCCSAISVWIRLQLHESPVFERIKAEGKTSKAPLTEAFGQWKNLKIVLLALFGLTAGQAVVWYTGQFYTLFFLTQTLKVDGTSANILIAVALLIGTPFFVFFGSLSDRIGRKPIIMAGCLIAALTLLPALQGAHALHEPDAGSGDGEVADRRDRQSRRVLVPVQSGGHVEVHHRRAISPRARCRRPA